MQVELRELQRRPGITTIMVTHDQVGALTMADRIAIIRDGCLEQVGSPEEVYQRPVSRFIASLLGAANFFRGKVVAEEAGRVHVAVRGGLTLSVRASRRLGDTVTVSLRPETVRVKPAADGDEPGALNATGAIIEQVIYHGFVSHLYMRRPDGERLIVFLQNEAGSASRAIEPGMRVRAEWAEDGNHIVRDEEVRASGVVLPGA